MRISILSSWPGVLLLVTASTAGGALAGCGDERQETGTQVELPDSVLEDVKRSDAYYDEQAKPARKRESGPGIVACRLTGARSRWPARYPAEPGPSPPSVRGRGS